MVKFYTYLYQKLSIEAKFIKIILYSIFPFKLSLTATCEPNFEKYL
jgi:hypothetical protein